MPERSAAGYTATPARSGPLPKSPFHSRRSEYNERDLSRINQHQSAKAHARSPKSFLRRALASSQEVAMPISKPESPGGARPAIVPFLLRCLGWGIIVGIVSFSSPELRLFTGATNRPLSAHALTPTVTGFSQNPVEAFQSVVIKGTGFSATEAENNVIFTQPREISAQIVSASPEELTVLTPFGAGSGRIKVVVRNQGDALSNDDLNIKTSISGIVQEDLYNQPVKDVTVRVVFDFGTLNTTTTDEGVFVLTERPDLGLPPALLVYDVDGGAATPCYGMLSKRIRVSRGRDNHVPDPIVLHKCDGRNIIVGRIEDGTPSRRIAEAYNPLTYLKAASKSLAAAAPPRVSNANSQEQQDIELKTNGSTVLFPDGKTSGGLNLGVYAREQAPTTLPVGRFSSTIAQILPLGVTFKPGAKLIFRNRDKIRSNNARLFALDQKKRSNTLGEFVDAGPATLILGGLFVEATIKETGYYFVSTSWETGRLRGNVIETDGRPVPRARVIVRGQVTFTNERGEFTLPNVPVLAAGDKAIVVVTKLRPDGRVDTIVRPDVPVEANKIVDIEPVISLPQRPVNHPPMISAPASLSMRVNETGTLDFKASDPDSGQKIMVSIAGVAFATLRSTGNDNYSVRLAPGANDAGNFNLNLIAVDNLGIRTVQTVLLKVSP
ncbi:MAG: carboxypeptidase-like regulatory domain-containing protein [Blastocatellia bacterium]